MTKISTVKRVTDIMADYRLKRLRLSVEKTETVTDDNLVPASLSREAEALEIIRAVRDGECN